MSDLAGTYRLRVNMTKGADFIRFGSVVELSDEDARRGLAQGTIEPVKDGTPSVAPEPAAPPPPAEISTKGESPAQESAQESPKQPQRKPMPRSFA